MTEGFQHIYTDLHVHLGGIKIAAAKDLTVAGILEECLVRKGIGMVGIIDAAAPPALSQLEMLVQTAQLAELSGGGLEYQGAAGKVTLILGCEVEVYHGAPLHLLCYFPDFGSLRQFSRWQADKVTNPNLSTQRHRAVAAAVVDIVAELGGFVVPAHCFTPHKSILAAARAVSPVIPPDLWPYVPAVELGLSADTAMADQIPELAAFTYITNSDAHSRGKIAREYNELRVKYASFAELWLALQGAEGRRVAANYGLDPRLGKYHRSYCLKCNEPIPGPPPQQTCPRSPAHRIVMGVLDRVHILSRANPSPAPPARPPYITQVPLQFVPGLGPKGLGRLLAAFGTEMAVLHQADPAALAEVVGPELAARIDAARRGQLDVRAGAGGIYGKLVIG